MSTLNILLQFILPHHAISRLTLWLTRIRRRWFKNLLIGLFMRGFRPDLADAESPDPFAYEHFNAFFTRALRAGARPLAGDAHTVVSPVDGAMNQCGSLDGNRLLQAKGRWYRLQALLAGAAPDWAQRFTGGSFATLYLAPFNYHRVHMPVAGRLAAAWYVPGRLFSVNTVASRLVADLFARNERLVLLFEGESGPFAVILVGALNVGCMATVWHGEVTPRRPRVVTQLPLPPERDRYRERGAEIGRFNMGSTVIVLFGPTTAGLARIATGTPVRMGQRLGELRGGAPPA
ncbi:MAG TPA: archaetidylserine decarboxylase [Steroidobacteraceae bacterium]|nr:archaetidylserine decarboxylase [Steroidobacteraceae bacterium]